MEIVALFLTGRSLDLLAGDGCLLLCFAHCAIVDSAWVSIISTLDVLVLVDLPCRAI